MEKYSWLCIETEEDLRKRFKFKELKSIVLSDLGLQDVIKISTFSNLFRVIKALSSFKKEKIDTKSEFFISKEHELGFMLLNYHKDFNSTLGISHRHYVDKRKAKEWRNEYIKIFHTDHGVRFPRQEEIVSSINQIYKRMVGEA